MRWGPGEKSQEGTRLGQSGEALPILGGGSVDGSLSMLPCRNGSWILL